MITEDLRDLIAHIQTEADAGREIGPHQANEIARQLTKIAQTLEETTVFTPKPEFKLLEFPKPTLRAFTLQDILSDDWNKNDDKQT